MSPAVDHAVARVSTLGLRPLPHHLCSTCNPQRRRPFSGVCPGCQTKRGPQ